MSTTQIVTVCRILLLLIIIATTHAHAENMSNASARIDEIITVDLKKYELQPNPPASDTQFVRRVYLDVNGRIPTSGELQRFFGDSQFDR